MTDEELMSDPKTLKEQALRSLHELDMDFGDWGTRGDRGLDPYEFSRIISLIRRYIESVDSPPVPRIKTRWVPNVENVDGNK